MLVKSYSSMKLYMITHANWTKNVMGVFEANSDVK